MRFLPSRDDDPYVTVPSLMMVAHAAESLAPVGGDAAR